MELKSLGNILGLKFRSEQEVKKTQVENPGTRPGQSWLLLMPPAPTRQDWGSGMYLRQVMIKAHFFEL